jgi:hypothetical protein
MSDQTYHGAPIPDDLWGSWNTGSSEVLGFQRGVLATLQITTEKDQAEQDRLESLAEARDAAEHAAWKAAREARNG